MDFGVHPTIGCRLGGHFGIWRECCGVQMLYIDNIWDIYSICNIYIVYIYNEHILVFMLCCFVCLTTSNGWFRHVLRPRCQWSNVSEWLNLPRVVFPPKKNTDLIGSKPVKTRKKMAIPLKICLEVHNWSKKKLIVEKKSSLFKFIELFVCTSRSFVQVRRTLRASMILYPSFLMLLPFPPFLRKTPVLLGTSAVCCGTGLCQDWPWSFPGDHCSSVPSPSRFRFVGGTDRSGTVDSTPQNDPKLIAFQKAQVLKRLFRN